MPITSHDLRRPSLTATPHDHSGNNNQSHDLAIIAPGGEHASSRQLVHSKLGTSLVKSVGCFLPTCGIRIPVHTSARSIQ